MKINDTLNNADAAYLNRLDESGKSLERQPAARSEGALAVNDTVDIRSTQLQDIIARAAQAAPESRAEKVSALRASLADGSYNVDSRAIAEKMLQAERELFE